MAAKTLMTVICGVSSVFASTVANAEFAKITEERQFRSLVAGKTLVRPLVRLQVTPGGEISGIGATWPVTGKWSWRNGYFCRDLNWGGSELGYNCQEVTVTQGRVRFTSDRGEGKSADFRISQD